MERRCCSKPGQPVEGRRDAAGRARISVPAVAMELLIAPVLADFRRAYPAFQLDIIVEDRLTDPVAQQYDAVIRRGDLLEQDMIARRLSADDRLIMVASTAWLDSRGLPQHPRDLAADRIVIRRPRSGAILPWSLSRSDEAVTMRGASSLVVENAPAARDYALSGLGVALLARAFVEEMLADGRLHLILPEWSASLSGFYLMYVHRGHLAPPVGDLMQRIMHHSALRPRQNTD